MELLGRRFGETWLDGDRFYHDFCQWKIVAVRGLIADGIKHVQSLEDLAKDRVLAIELRQRGEADIELATIRNLRWIDVVGQTRHGHRAADMTASKFGRYCIARSTGAGTIFGSTPASRIAGLDQSAGKRAMEAHTIVEALSTKLLEVRHRRGCGVIIETNNDLLQISFLADLDLHDSYLGTNRGGEPAGEAYKDKDES